MTPTDGAKAFIVNKKLNKILLLLRDDKPSIPSPNCWSLFGGAVESGESPIEAMRRELVEEVNIEVYGIRLIDKIDVELVLDNLPYIVIGHIFIAYTDAELETIEIYEGQRAEYFTIDEIKALKNIAPGALSSIAKYEKLFT